MASKNRAHWIYKIYRRDTGELFCEGTSKTCAAALGVALGTFSGAKGERICRGLNDTYYGTRTWIGVGAEKHNAKYEEEIIKQAERMRRERELAPKKEQHLVDRYCVGCIYRTLISDRLYCCSYFEMAGTLRPCHAGTGCTVRKKGKVKRNLYLNYQIAPKAELEEEVETG